MLLSPSGTMGAWKPPLPAISPRSCWVFSQELGDRVGALRTITTTTRTDSCSMGGGSISAFDFLFSFLFSLWFCSREHETGSWLLFHFLQPHTFIHATIQKGCGCTFVSILLKQMPFPSCFLPQIDLFPMAKIKIRYCLKLPLYPVRGLK